MTDALVPVFDGHNDVLSRLMHEGRNGAEARFLNGQDDVHIDLPRARKGGLRGGLCAVFVSTDNKDLDANGNLPPVPRDSALDQTIAQAALLRRIEAQSAGAFKVCTTAAAIRATMAAGDFAAVFHIE
ncbi:MAG TPA: membrane dipeptidase, partial [Paenirhodobacter sp.]